MVMISHSRSFSVSCDIPEVWGWLCTGIPSQQRSTLQFVAKHKALDFSVPGQQRHAAVSLSCFAGIVPFCLWSDLNQGSAASMGFYPNLRLAGNIQSSRVGSRLWTGKKANPICRGVCGSLMLTGIASREISTPSEPGMTLCQASFLIEYYKKGGLTPPPEMRCRYAWASPFLLTKSITAL